MNDLGLEIPMVINNCISVQAVAFHSGYNVQYLRRLLRDGRLPGMKLGQTWLIDKGTFEAYLENANRTQDKRFGRKWFLSGDVYECKHPRLLQREWHRRSPFMSCARIMGTNIALIIPVQLHFLRVSNQIIRK